MPGDRKNYFWNIINANVRPPLMSSSTVRVNRDGDNRVSSTTYRHTYQTGGEYCGEYEKVFHGPVKNGSYYHNGTQIRVDIINNSITITVNDTRKRFTGTRVGIGKDSRFYVDDMRIFEFDYILPFQNQSGFRGENVNFRRPRRPSEFAPIPHLGFSSVLKEPDKRKGIFLSEDAGRGATVTYNEGGENAIASNTTMSSPYDVGLSFFPELKDETGSFDDYLFSHIKSRIDQLKRKESNWSLLKGVIGRLSGQKGLSQEKIVEYLQDRIRELPLEEQNVQDRFLARLFDSEGALINIPVYFENNPDVIFDFDAMYERYEKSLSLKRQPSFLLSMVRVSEDKYKELRGNVENIIGAILQQSRTAGDGRRNKEDVHWVPATRSSLAEDEDSSDANSNREKGYFGLEELLSNDMRSRFSPYMQRYLEEFNNPSRDCYSERLKVFVAIEPLSPEEEKKRKSYSNLTHRGEIINIPVTVHEHSYDLADVLQFIQDAAKCPGSGEEITESDIEPNREMNEAIKEFLKEITDARCETVSRKSSQLIQKQETPYFCGNGEERCIRSRLSLRMQKYLKEEHVDFSSQNYSNRLEAFIKIKPLSFEEEKKQDGYLDPITFNLINIPVTLYGRCYDLDTLIGLIQKGGAKCPYTGDEFTWPNILPSRAVNAKIKGFLQEVMDARLDNNPRKIIAYAETRTPDSCENEESQQRGNLRP